MYFKEPLIPTANEHVFQLAPIPVYQRIYDDSLSDSVYNLGLDVLDDKQKLMGQELPKQYDSERQSTYGVNYDRQDQWVENHEFPPIGSRFYTPPNNFLYHEDEGVNVIKRRIFNGFYLDCPDEGLFKSNSSLFLRKNGGFSIIFLRG
jgi:hypothetical protein